jgi:ferredoxin-thioredoxin reductase catalytic subunit
MSGETLNEPRRPREEYCAELEARLNADPIFIAELLDSLIQQRRKLTDPLDIASHDAAIDSLRQDFDAFGIPIDLLI